MAVSCNHLHAVPCASGACQDVPLQAVVAPAVQLTYCLRACSAVPLPFPSLPQTLPIPCLAVAQVKWDQLKRLVAFLQKLSLGQVDTLSDMLAALSPGQIAVAVRLLDKLSFVPFLG